MYTSKGEQFLYIRSLPSLYFLVLVLLTFKFTENNYFSFSEPTQLEDYQVIGPSLGLTVLCDSVIQKQTKWVFEPYKYMFTLDPLSEYSRASLSNTNSIDSMELSVGRFYPQHSLVNTLICCGLVWALFSVWRFTYCKFRHQVSFGFLHLTNLRLSDSLLFSLRPNFLNCEIKITAA